MGGCQPGGPGWLSILGDITDLTRLPSDLPVPVDDGATDHLVGMALPPVSLPSTGGRDERLDGAPTPWLVVYVYPRTGGPGISLPDDWDLIPGARGCTPQSCSFRDHHAELQALGATVRGVSAQPIAEQHEFVERMHIPFPLLNDSALRLAGPPLRLPTFTADDTTLYKRVTLVAERGIIRHVVYPVFPPDRNAQQVIDFLSTLPPEQPCPSHSDTLPHTVQARPQRQEETVMDELMQAIQERTGLPAEKAQGAAEAAMAFFKDKLPGGLGERLEEVVAGNTDAIADAAGSLTDRAKGMFS